jgi:hypothetical protein
LYGKRIACQAKREATEAAAIQFRSR